LSVRFVSLREFAAQTMEFAALVERRARGGLRRGLQQPIACLPRRLDGFRPRATQLQNLGAPHKTLPAIGDQIRLRHTPARQRRRPLLRPPEVKHLQTAFDDAAVDIADNEWGYFAGVYGDHRLIQQTDAVPNLAHSDQDPTAAVPCECDQVAIAKTVADLRSLAEHTVGTGSIAGEHALQCDGKEQVPLLDAILACVVEQLARPRDPAASPGTLALVHQTERQPERTSRGGRDGTTPQEFLVRTRPALRTLRVLANQVRGRREPFEILW
jgi:hypothetical protein